MILKVFMQLGGESGISIRHSICDLNNREIAVGDNRDDGAFVTLTYQGKEYRYAKRPIKIEKSIFDFPLQISAKSKTTWGHRVTQNGETVLRVYTESITCGKIWIFKQSMGISVYQYQGRTYHVSKVGFLGETSHYYCLRSAEFETLAIIERHSFTDDTNRATIYLKDVSLLELVLLVCANEIMMVSFSVGDMEKRDPSAGQYISMTEAEKSMYDKDFIPAVKAMDGIID